LQTIFAKNFQKKSKNTKFFPMAVNGIEIAHLPYPMLKSLPLKVVIGQGGGMDMDKLFHL
jgi:hypothetical protein